MTIIDANYILRWFLNDVEAQAAIVDSLLTTASPSSLIIDRVTIAEVSYVLRSKGYDHRQIFHLFEEIYHYPSLKSPTSVDTVALSLYRDTKLDFEDCILLANNQTNGYCVGTFDKAILKLSKTIV